MMINIQYSDKRKFDIIVVGAGLAGCSTAYYLNKGGMKVALLEMREVCSGASGRMGGQVLELEPATSEAAAGGKYTLVLGRPSNCIKPRFKKFARRFCRVRR